MDVKRFLKWFGVMLDAGLCVRTIYGFIWIRQDRQLTDEAPGFVFSSDIPDTTCCAMEAAPGRLDPFFPAEAEPACQVPVIVHDGSFTSRDKRKSSGILDIPLLTEKTGVWGDAVVETMGSTDLTQPMDWLQRWLDRPACGADSPDNERFVGASSIQ